MSECMDVVKNMCYEVVLAFYSPKTKHFYTTTTVDADAGSSNFRVGAASANDMVIKTTACADVFQTYSKRRAALLSSFHLH